MSGKSGFLEREGGRLAHGFRGECAGPNVLVGCLEQRPLSTSLRLPGDHGQPKMRGPGSNGSTRFVVEGTDPLKAVGEWWENRLASGGMTIGRCLLVLAAVYAVVACGGSDAERVREASEDGPAPDGPVSAGLQVMGLEEGDCVVFDLEIVLAMTRNVDTGPSVESVAIVPCSDEWQYRVVTVFDVADADHYPGTQGFASEAALRCGDDAAVTLYPTPESWDLGDRTIVCLAQAPPPATTQAPPPATTQAPPPITTRASTTSTTVKQSGDDSDVMLSEAEVYELVAPSIAFIETELSTGTGILLDGGYVLTNHRAVWPRGTARVVFPDGTELEDVPVVGRDPFADLAVLGPVSVSAQPLALRNGEDLSPGSSVFLVGVEYPAETDLIPQVSITEGTFTRFHEWDLMGLTLFQTYFLGGGSGGALVNANGEVIGISRWGQSLVATSAADAAGIVETLIEEEAALAWYQSVRSPGVGDFEFDVELVNRWDSRAFTFVGAAGTIVAAAIDGAADGVLTISSPPGLHLLSNESLSGVESASVQVLIDGIHYLDVSTVLDGSAIFPTMFTVTSSSRLQPFEDSDDGQHLVVGDVVGGVIDYYWDIDWYTIDLNEGDTVVVWTDAIDTDTAIFVDYPQADIDDIVYDDDSGRTWFWRALNAELIYTAPASGQFIIAVTGAGEDWGIGGYFLGVEPVEG